MLDRIYDTLPKRLQPPAKEAYYRSREVSSKAYYSLPGKTSPDELYDEFVRTFFDSHAEYQQYVDELSDRDTVDTLDEAHEEYSRLKGTEREEVSFGGMPPRIGGAFYALVRKYEPETIVETGVCNGSSTLYLLLAIDENSTGTLHSIDYPFRADESLAEFRAKTFDNYGGAAIPADKDPGWIIPQHLRSNWELTIGKSQEELPRVLDSLDGLDMFFHDSEHSAPCMMMEYELAYNHLGENGFLLSDDIDWNDAWDTFRHSRQIRRTALLSPSVGILEK